MMKARSPTQFSSFFKSFFAIFAVQALVVLIIPYEVVAPIRVQVLVFNISSSLLLGWALYKRASHLTFTYDETVFTLRRGKEDATTHRWTDFTMVSLARTEHGDFFVKLHRNEDFFTLPVSKLKLDPFRFRDEVTKLVRSHR